jgi:hypothetical protein
MARAKVTHGNVLILDKLIMRCEGDELFLYQGGKRIAKRGHSGTRHAGQWLPLEPGIEVREVRRGSERVVDVVYDINSPCEVGNRGSGSRMGEIA